jgi:hypothetical protein
LVLARSRGEALRKLIAPGALVFLATKKRWLRTPEEKLARQLAHHGCRVSLQTLHCEDRDIKLFGFIPGDKPAQNGKMSYPHFYHVVRL